MRRLLLISYHFPPSNEVAGKPTARLVRYLRDFGWEPVVLTIPADDGYVIVDPQGYTDVLRETRVERVRRRFHPFDALAGLSRMIRGLRRSGRQHTDVPTSQDGSKQLRNAASLAPVGAQVGARAFVRELLEYPDVRAGWVLPAFWHARRMLLNEHFDAMMTVSPPHSASLIGLLLKPFELPWVAQFHDPWADECACGSKLLKKLTRQLEGRVVAASDLVLNATEEVTESLVARYPREPREKFDTLHNGFDPIDFPPVASGRPAARAALRLTHTGSLYGGRNPYPLFGAVARLFEQGVIKPHDLEIRLIGDCREAMGRSVENEVKRLGVEAFVRVEAPVSYPAALAALAESDVLLLFAQNQPFQVPAKLFEYLNLRRFILAFANGATARIVNETASGLIVDSDDVDAVAAALRKVFEMARHRVWTANKAGDDQMQRYTAVSLAQQLARRLNEVVGDDSSDEPSPCQMSCTGEAVITPR